MSDAAPCGTCSALAYSARHFPYLVDDAVAQTRVWHCHLCGTWWRETPWGVLVTDPVELDGHAPGWRHAADQVATTRLDDLVPALRDGRLGPETGALALLHHDIVVGSGARPDEEPVVLFLDEATAARSGSPAPERKSAVDAVRGTRGSVIVLRSGTGEYRFDRAGSDHLRLVARATAVPGTKEDVVAEAMVPEESGTGAPKEHWTFDELDALSPEEQRAARAMMRRRAGEEDERQHGPFRPELIGSRKGELPTITRLVSTPEERAARARARRGERG